MRLLGEGGSATVEGVDSALRASCLNDFVTALPQGLDTIVGETGRRLSAGQARRLTIARALLKVAPFLILDEPTEGLDDATAEAMMESVTAHAKQRGVLIISHRKRDLRYADEVVTLSGG